MMQFLQDNMLLIGIVALAVIPLGYVYRQYTYPFLFHTVEGAVYAAIYNCVLWGLVTFFRWFRNASSMEAIEGNSATATWSIPLLTPWDRAAYDPPWVFFLQVAGWIGIVYLIIFIRPVGTKNQYKRQAKPTKVQKSKSSARAAYRAKIDSQRAGKGAIRKD